MSCKHEKYISTGVYSSDDECESCGLLRSTVEASKPMSLQKESEWEEKDTSWEARFDARFPFSIYGFRSAGASETTIEELLHRDGDYFKSIKSFIRQERGALLREIMEEINGMRFDDDLKTIERNEALNDVQEIIRKKI